MSKIWQEFYCRGCSGYISVKLNLSLNHEVEIVCPKCKDHKHRRVIRDGKIYENGRFSNEPKEQICPTLSSWHEQPLTERMKSNHGKSGYCGERRDGVVIDEGTSNKIMKERWLEIYGGNL